MTHGWDNARKVNTLGDLHGARLKWALQVNVRDLIAKVGLHADESNKTILDGDLDVCSLRDGLLNLALGLDHELLATVLLLVNRRLAKSLRDIRLGRVRRKVDALNCNQILVMRTRAKCKGRLAWNLVVVVDGEIESVPALEAHRRRRPSQSREAGEAGEERESHSGGWGESMLLSVVGVGMAQGRGRQSSSRLCKRMSRDV